MWTVAEQAGQTSFDTPSDFAFSKFLFWHARAFDPTTNGPWSEIRSFQTGAQPLSRLPREAAAVAVRQLGNLPDRRQAEALRIASSPRSTRRTTEEGAFEVTKRIAWLLRGEGGGLLIKNGGENIVSWKGYSFAAARICYPDGHIYKVLSDVPTTQRTELAGQ